MVMIGILLLYLKNRNILCFFCKSTEGDYKVTVTIGNKQYAGVTVLRAETRRLVVERMITKKGELRDVTFNVNVRTPYIDGKNTVGLQMRERKIGLGQSFNVGIQWKFSCCESYPNRIQSS